METVTETFSSRDTIRVLAALSDENRFRIVELLSSQPKELSCGAIGLALFVLMLAVIAVGIFLLWQSRQ